MISKVLRLIENGLNVMHNNSRLVLVAILLFVFPLFFVWVTQSFFTTASNNIDTAEKSRVGIIHDSIATILKSSTDNIVLTDVLIDKFTNDNPDITKIRVVDKDENGFLIISATNKELVGTYEKTDQLYRSLPLLSSEDSFIVKLSIDNVRTWQVFSGVELADNELFIFSEHRFDLVDSVMSSRRQYSYFGLTAIFIFLIALAYWLNRQVYWEKHHGELAKQLKDRDLFSNMIAHEFRSPLTAIKGYASFLQESKNLSTEEVRFATNIRTSAERLVVLVSDFLEVARLQAGKMKVDNEKVDVREVLVRVIEDLSVMAEEKGLKLAYVQSSDVIMMITDKARLTQVMTNVISNSIKYSNTGTIEVECVSTSLDVSIRVKDTGMGISSEDQQKLFAPFSRVGGVESSSITGTGLGMWITKQLVELLSGTIGVESIKGVGTHIVIKFKTK